MWDDAPALVSAIVLAMRTRPLRSPVTVTFDGRKVAAERGEPVAAALVGQGAHALARSAKFHRPRGPACFRGACDGCLARVNDVPNVMTCLVPAEDGMVIESQNTLGTLETDFLRMTDWFFPQGMNHHELLAGVPGLQRVMQVFARRVAGLGRLPREIVAPRAAIRRSLDVLVVGAGPAGMAVATELARRGRAVEIVDDALAAGGGAAALDEEDGPWRAIRDAFTESCARGAITLRCETTAAAFYGNDVLVVGQHPDTGAQVVKARAVVIATGAHDGVVAFEGNDVPGVMSARAAGWLLARGVLPGKSVVVVVSVGGGPVGDAFARNIASSGAPCEVTVFRGEPLRAIGSSRVKQVIVRDGAGREHTRKADALLIDAPRAPAYELCEQAGGALVHEARGFVVKTERGKIRDGVWAVGEVTGAPFDAAVVAKHAADLASRICDA